MKPIILELKAKHFKGSAFCNTGMCPVSTATREQLTATIANTGVFTTTVDNVKYSLDPPYEWQLYITDKPKAESLNYSNAVIRKIKLTKV